MSYSCLRFKPSYLLPLLVLAVPLACSDSDSGGGASGATGGRTGGAGGRLTGGAGGTGGKINVAGGTAGAVTTGGAVNSIGGSAGSAGLVGAGGAAGNAGNAGMAGAPGGAGGAAAVKVVCDPDNGGLTLPPGFCALAVADNLGPARHFAIAPSGDVFVAINNSTDGVTKGKVIALRDTTGNGRLDQRQTFGNEGGNGIEWRDGYLYFAENSRVIRWALPNGVLTPSSAPEVVVSGLPGTGDHASKTIAFGPDARLFVNIGSATNSCQVQNRTLLSPGIDPCPELLTRAGIWRFEPGLLGQIQTDGLRYASGLRNTVALTVRPGTSELWGVQNGRDQLNENWPGLFSAEQDQNLPSEALYLIANGADYGWPYCYYDSGRGNVLAPEYGGNGVDGGRCTGAPLPKFAFPAHFAPLGMHFYGGQQFPSRYHGGLFVTFHGSRFTPNPPGPVPGYKMMFLPFENGQPGIAAEAFADGFSGPNRPLPDQAMYRPVGVGEGPDGSLYVSDDKAGRLWRILYQ